MYIGARDGGFKKSADADVPLVSVTARCLLPVASHQPAMSIARSSECLLCIFRRPNRLSAPRIRRSLHSTPLRRKDDSESSKDDIIDLPEQGQKSQTTPTQQWKERYDERQVEAIEAAKKLIGGRFDKGKNVARTDPWSVNYYDNFEKIDPVVDEPVRAPWENLDDDLRMMTSEEADAKFQNFLETLPPDGSGGDDPQTLKYIKFLDSMRVTVGKQDAELNVRSAMAPTIPSEPKKILTAEQEQGSKAEGSDGEGYRGVKEFTPEFVRLMQMTGYSARELSKLRVKAIFVNRVSNQTRLGKVGKMYFLSIAGNGKGLLGIGEGSADDAVSARNQSQYRAIRSMQPIKRYENRTIFGTVSGKVSATELELYARPPGTRSTMSRPWPHANKS